MTDKIDMVNHPKHYISKKGIEVIDVIEAFTDDLNGPEAYYTGNIIKYICRWKHKNGIEDLKKAQWYLNRLIKTLEDSSPVLNSEFDWKLAQYESDIPLKKEESNGNKS